MLRGVRRESFGIYRSMSKRSSRASRSNLSAHARIPVGNGPGLTYQPYDVAAGIPPKETAILFLAYSPEHKTGGLPANLAPVECPAPAAVTDGSAQFPWTGHGGAFRLTTDQPVVAYQMMPYGGGSAAVTGATLLIPTSAWDTNYLAVEATKSGVIEPLPPSMNIVAMEDGTEVSFVPNGDIQAWGMGDNLLTPSPKNQKVTYVLDRGEQLQFVEHADFSGSPIESTKPVGLFGGHYCMNLPNDTPYCDHAEQQIPAVRSFGFEYAAVGHRDRTFKPENRRWRIVGAADGTKLTFDGGGPGEANIGRGSVLEFQSDDPFVVKSQDSDHPFLMFAYMSSSLALDMSYGDPDFVRVVPPEQYLDHYVFFTDPTYPETNLVVVRKRGDSGFFEVSLDCSGVLDGWKPVGSTGQYEYTRIDLVSHDFEPQNGCNTGRREMSVGGNLWRVGLGVGHPRNQSGRVLERPRHVYLPCQLRLSGGGKSGKNQRRSTCRPSRADQSRS